MPFHTLFFLSAIAGLVGAVSGMGGGVILVPTLVFFGFDIKHTIAISNLSIAALSVTTTWGYLRRHMPSLTMSTFLEVFAVLGAWLGAWVTIYSGRRPLFFLCGGILLISGMLLSSKQKEYKSARPPDGFSQWLGIQGSYYDYTDHRTETYFGHNAMLAGFLMFGVGLVSGALGIGASALTCLILEGVTGLPTKVSLSTSPLIVGIMALIGTDIYIESGLMNSGLVAPVLLGVPCGALLGIRLFVHLDRRVVRGIFLAVLVIFAMEMFVFGIRGTR